MFILWSVASSIPLLLYSMILCTLMQPPFEASIAKMVITVPCRALPPLDACVSKKNPTDSSKTFNEKVEEWGERSHS